MKKVLSFKTVYLFLLSCFAQEKVDFNNYTPLVCKGAITEDFKIELSRYVEREKKSNTGVNQNEKAQEVTFSEISNYQLNNILFSGRVLYGDVLTDYINKVADIVLKDDEDLRNELRFYVLKNTDLNAYSTHRGVIFISMGLLAQIESEAQLAFILCHEIVHYKNSHNLEAYKNNQKVLSDRKNTNFNRRVSNILNYSKENELEADREGLDLFLKTPYGTNELNNLFDVMLYSYLPFDEIQFDTLYFNSTKDYIMPEKYFLSNVGDITAEEDVVDSLSTHPNIKKRRERIQSLLESKNNKKGVSFVNGEAHFKNIQKIARHEVAIIYLQEGQLEQALYTGYLIEKVYGKTMFTDKIITGALFARSKQRVYSKDDYFTETYESDDDDSELKWEKVEGESQAVFYFFHTIPARELSILTSRKLLEGHKLYKDAFFKDRFNSIVYDLVNEYDMNRSDFLEEYKSKKDSAISVNQDDTASLDIKDSKVAKIKKSKATQSERKSKRKDNKYFQYAFEENYNDSLFIEAFRKFGKQSDADEDTEKADRYRRYKKRREKITEKYGEGLGIDKLILINPFFSTNNKKLTPLEEIHVEQNLMKYVLEYADNIDLQVDIIGSTLQKEIETDKFNDFQQLINWLSERVAIGKMETYAYTDQYMEKYVQEYGHLGFCYVVKYNKSLKLVFVLFDLETGKIEYLYEKKFLKGKPDGILTRMMLYEALHQIHQDAPKIDKLKRKYQINE